MCAFPKRSELYCGLFNDCLLTVCFSLFLCFLVRVRCRRKKLTFDISSADEFLVIIMITLRGESTRSWRMKWKWGIVIEVCMFAFERLIHLHLHFSVAYRRIFTTFIVHTCLMNIWLRDVEDDKEVIITTIITKIVSNLYMTSLVSIVIIKIISALHALTT